MKERLEEDFELETQDDNKGLIEFLGKLLSNWYWFALCGFIGLAIAFLKLRYSTPQYRINAKVLVTDGEKGSSTSGQGAFMGDFNNLFGGVSSVDNEAEILKTRYLMEQVVQKLNAQVNYYLPGNIRDVEIFRPPFHVSLLQTDSLRGGTFYLTRTEGENILITRDGFEQEAIFNQPFDLPGLGTVLITRNADILLEDKPYKFQVVSLDSRVNEYMGRLSVAVNNKLVSIISLAFEYPLKDKGEEILRTIIRTYTENNLKAKNTIADSTISFIETRLVFVGQELGDVEGDIETFRQSRQLADMNTQSQLLLQNSSDYIKELAEVETQLNIMANLKAYLLDEANERVLPIAILPNDMIFNSLVERYNTLLLDRDRRLLSATPDNPSIQNLNKQLSNLRADMLANMNNTQNRLEIIRNDLERKTGQLESEVTSIPATERKYLDLTRQQQIKQELYVYLLQKREETAISKTANISNSRVIDPPKVAAHPFSPRRSTTLLVGLLIGLAVPFIIIYLRNLLNTRVHTVEDITRYTQVPVAGEISHSPSKETLVVGWNSRSAIAEQFRSLRTNLAFYLNDPNRKTILLTSSMSGEGKSFVALNMAMIFAISKKKVVVMEMDLRKPNLSTKLNITNDFGYTNYVITQSLAPADIIKPSGIHEGLFIISSGPIPPNPAETILSNRMDELMTYMKKEFDYIIIDAPPVGLVTDAQLLSDHADLTLYLVRRGFTHKNQLAIPESLYRNQKMKQIALLINDMKSKGGYGYGPGYGSYGEDAENHRKRWWWPFRKKR
ncbi:GumC family protein [Parapedobacter tibetensis]|uniref:GumC family protein n=1 Tax=Parapedobacter tibetensis TaxID=2972951 RepID=UPI00214DC1B2|nr:tyrosine-protein kinase [Parapedobacter tibetensis]